MTVTIDAPLHDPKCPHPVSECICPTLAQRVRKADAMKARALRAALYGDRSDAGERFR